MDSCNKKTTLVHLHNYFKKREHSNGLQTPEVLYYYLENESFKMII